MTGSRILAVIAVVLAVVAAPVVELQVARSDAVLPTFWFWLEVAVIVAGVSTLAFSWRRRATTRPDQRSRVAQLARAVIAIVSNATGGLAVAWCFGVLSYMRGPADTPSWTISVLPITVLFAISASCAVFAFD